VARALVVCLLAALAGCGGSDSGSGNSDGGTPLTQRPTINASIAVLAPLDGPSPTAFAYVEVLNQAGTSPILGAVITINGTALSYVAADKAYEGDLNLQPGQHVDLTVTVAGVNYTVSSNLSNDYPGIDQPVVNTTWNNNASNHVQWTDAAAGAGASHLLGLLGANTADWPADGFVLVPGSQNSYDISPGNLLPDSYLLLVGSLKEIDVPGAATGSALDLAVFAHRDVQVSSVADPPSGVSIKDIVIDTYDPTALVVGTSRQLNARARYTDFSDRYITGLATWSSSNLAVLTVSPQGNVTAVAPGTAQLSISYSGFLMSVTVSVFQPTAIPAGAATRSTALQIDPAHSGYVTLGGAGIALPLSGRWTATLNGPVYYPVVANGRVFVTTAAPALSHPNGYGASLYALDVTTGAIVWGPVDLPTTYNVATLAYDQGRLFVVNFDGLLRAFDAGTGAEIWSRTYPIGFVNKPPVAVGGMVFLSSTGALVAVDQSYGGLLWSVVADSAGPVSPAVSPDGVFVSGACHVYKYALLTGEPLWNFSGGCYGSGARSPSYSNGRLIVRDASQEFPGINSTNGILHAGTGAILAAFPSRDLPGLAGDFAYYLSNGSLGALNMATSAMPWTFAGDLDLNTPPIVIDNVVVTASGSGTVYMVDRGNGQQLWSGQAAAPPVGLNENQNGPLATMGVGDGYLVVPGGNTLTGWKLVP